MDPARESHSTTTKLSKRNSLYNQPFQGIRSMKRIWLQRLLGGLIVLITVVVVMTNNSLKSFLKVGQRPEILFASRISSGYDQTEYKYEEMYEVDESMSDNNLKLLAVKKEELSERNFYSKNTESKSKTEKRNVSCKKNFQRSE